MIQKKKTNLVKYVNYIKKNRSLKHVISEN